MPSPITVRFNDSDFSTPVFRVMTQTQPWGTLVEKMYCYAKQGDGAGSKFEVLIRNDHAAEPEISDANKLQEIMEAVGITVIRGTAATELGQ
jgi:hypothetical protein